MPEKATGKLTLVSACLTLSVNRERSLFFFEAGAVFYISSAPPTSQLLMGGESSYIFKVKMSLDLLYSVYNWANQSSVSMWLTGSYLV